MLCRKSLTFIKSLAIDYKAPCIALIACNSDSLTAYP